MPQDRSRSSIRSASSWAAAASGAKQHSAEEKIRIVVSGLRGEDSLGRVLDTPLRLSLSVLAADTLGRGIKRAKSAHGPAAHLPPWVVA